MPLSRSKKGGQNVSLGSFKPHVTKFTGQQIQRTLIAVRDQGLLSLEIQTLCGMASVSCRYFYSCRQLWWLTALPVLFPSTEIFPISLWTVAPATVTERGGVGDIKKERGLRRWPRSFLGSLVNLLELRLPCLWKSQRD